MIESIKGFLIEQSDSIILIALAIIIGWIFKAPQKLWNIFWTSKKPNTNPETPTGKPASKDSPFATNETDYQRKILLLNKLVELETQLAEFKNVLQDSPVSSISAKPPHK